MRSFKYMGKAIREIRNRKGMTQAELGAKFKLHSQNVSNWERGHASPPAKVVREIAKDRWEVITIKRAIAKDALEDGQKRIDQIFKR